ncbi:NAD(P)-binding protein [Rhizopus microsporus var. microsporus]|uniref:Sex determination protein tasselseed-2 n=3 Tax=Rhizopus TaxID=4842 RepID=A0A2G4T1K0_RHIZD|nr:sex determination protein tasselseed-2 [Rhizopus microsporus ATCC 52813]ORE07250.1 NAD(P)-binding protein [Rhizopus microsporus var. microsporus]PHZ14879.1 sex determination protein tasselseed-2 [Rhizopus microsporus ATCC 52813]
MASTAAERATLIFNHITKASPSLKDKVCIVTGAGSIYGIGRATALSLAKRGPKVIYVTDLTLTNLDELVKEIETTYTGVRCIARAVDAASTNDVTAIIDEAMKEFGRLDIFVANAGIATGSRIHEEDAESFMKMMRINALSAFLAIKHAGIAMQQTGKGGKELSGGSIICTASVAGIRSGAGSPEYSASKAAVINLCQTASYQYAGTNVRVNAICPGLIETGMTKATFDYAKQRGTSHKIGQLNPTRRYGVASEIGHVIAFLASDEASYVNGQAIAVDGGLSASHPVVPGKFN